MPGIQLKRSFRLGTRLRGCDSDFCNLRPSEQLNSFRRPCGSLQKNNIRRSCAGRSLAQSKALLVWRITEYWFYKLKPFIFLIRLPLPGIQLKPCFRPGTRLRGCDSDFCNLRPSERLNSFRRPSYLCQKNNIRRSCAGRSPAQSKALLVWRIAEILVL